MTWDLALRGVRVAVAEMGGIVSGTSGRYHGLLHTGARYAVSDTTSARECWQEHQIIRRIAPLAIDATGGLFVGLPADDEALVPQWLDRCAAIGIPTEPVSPEAARRLDPALSPAIQQVFAVPDAACDSVALGRALHASIEAQGGQVLSYHRVVALHREGQRVVGARLHDLRGGGELQVYAAVTVIACGPWAVRVAALADVHYQMQLSRGAMLGFSGRWTEA